jgi:hypothetical protein
MKSLKNIIIFGAISLFVASCGEKPSDVAKKFTEATLKFDFNEAKKYVAKAYYEDIDKLIEQIEAPESQDVLEIIKANAKDAKIEIIEEQIAEDGNTATVKIKVSVMGEEDADNIPLIKEDGQWKVNKTIDLGNGK